MKSIYKYVLEEVNEQEILMPKGAKILCVQPQYGKVTMWAEVDRDVGMIVRKIIIIGTGHTLPEDYLSGKKYIGTCIVAGGNYVWHIYEEV